MNYNIQRASMLKRIPAWMLDMILLITLVTGFMAGWSYVFDVTPHSEKLDAIEQQYEVQYNSQLDISVEDYEKMTDEEKEQKMTEEERAHMNEIILEIDEALFQDAEYMDAFGKIISNVFSMVSLSFLCAYFVLEFLIPLWLKNGQTLGKKCFGVALMRKDGIKVTPFMMFTRTILGKCSIELMVPIMLYVILSGSIVGLAAGAIFLIAQIIVLFATYHKTAIHDLLACTVAVDLSSQMIFDSVEAMEAYHTELYADKTSDAE